jgi:nitrilase
VIEREELLVTTLHLEEVIKERHNFDPSGHYSRPDVFQLKVNRTRQTIIDFEE